MSEYLYRVLIYLEKGITDFLPNLNAKPVGFLVTDEVTILLTPVLADEKIDLEPRKQNLAVPSIKT